VSRNILATDRKDILTTPANKKSHLICTHLKINWNPPSLLMLSIPSIPFPFITRHCPHIYRIFYLIKVGFLKKISDSNPVAAYAEG
jgi:hypothetical protein